MAAIIPFENFTPENGELSIVTPRIAPGIGRIAYLNMRAPALAYVGPTDMRVQYAIKPSNLDEVNASAIKPYSKFDVELAIDETTMGKFEDACRTFDNWIVESAFAKKQDFFGNNSQYFTTVHSVEGMYASGRMLKAGKPKPEGGFYQNSIRCKIVGGWYKYAESVVTKPVSVEGNTRYLAERCIWKARPVSDPVAVGETKFWLKVGDTYTGKIDDGKGGVRLVGPGDCTPGSKVTPVFAISSIYINKGFGITITAKELYISPRVLDVERPVYAHGMLPGFICAEEENMDE